MLRRIELEVLATVDRGDTISELATKLDHSESYLSRAVADLVEKGLVYTERDGRRKRVVPSDARAVELYQDLVHQHSHIEFPELLTGKALEVLYYLDQPRTVSEIAEKSDNYRNTVNRVLRRFRNRGLVGIEDSQYYFTGNFEQLHEFARELVHYDHRQRLRSVVSDGTILWEGYDEFLAQTELEIDSKNFHETGLAEFARFGLQFLLTSRRYYLYSTDPDSLSPAALCCHVLLIDDGSRHRSYCALLISHLDIDEGQLRDQAAKYELEETIDALLQYLNTHGQDTGRRFPEWAQFRRLAADYEVSLSH